MVTAISIWLCYDRQPLRSDSHAVQCPHFCTCYPSFWKCGDSKASLWPLDNQPDAIIRGVRMLDLSGSDVDVLPNQSPAHNFPDLQLIILAQTIFDGQQCRELECLESLGIRVIAPRCPADKRTGCAYPPCCPWAAAARTRPRPPPSPTTDKSQSPLLPFINGETSTIFNPSRDREYSTRAMAPSTVDAADPSTYVPNIATTSQPILATHPLINTAADMGILPPLLLASHPGENISAAVSKSNDTELFVLNSSSNADVGQSERFELSSLSAGKDSDDDDDDEPLTTVVGLLLSPTTTPATLALPDATDRIVPCANISCPPCLLVGSSDGSAEVRMGLLADRFTAASIAVASVILLLVVILCILWKRGYRVIRGGGGGGAGSNQQDDGGDEDNDRSRGRRSASVWSWMRGVFNNNRDNSSSGGTNDDVNRRGMGLGRQIPGGYDGRRGDGRGGVSTNPIFNPGRQQHHGFSPVANRDSRTPTRHMPSPRPADYNPVLDDRVMNCFNDDSDHDHDYGNNDNNRRDRQQQVAGNNNARLLAEYRADDRESPVYSSPRSDVSRVIVSAEVHGRNNADQEQDEQGEHMYENVPLPALPLQPSSPNRSVSIGSADELMSGNSSAPPPISPHHNVRSSSMSRLEEVPEREEEEDDDDQHRVQAHDEEHGDNLVLERESSEHDGGGSGGGKRMRNFLMRWWQMGTWEYCVVAVAVVLLAAAVMVVVLAVDFRRMQFGIDATEVGTVWNVAEV
ncbi:uncharacterized protein LOC129585578 isoform X5 [Paramacrobiotus metropolitanus]|uniref:uncharacterized protein LOC129585578 isoform X5 n=1 Tax=Paramacrobiotus metropolitanus TaxID=2943436 RepID=UPI002445BB86|nr:uncharacterized protein LOC129585578 isoform X5 [Paramacrobiotus metropolitanus]